MSRRGKLSLGKLSRRQQIFAFGARLHDPHLVGRVAARQLERLFRFLVATRRLTPSPVSGSNGKVAAMPRINVGQPESK
jgi:hypothetical protein